MKAVLCSRFGGPDDLEIKDIAPPDQQGWTIWETLANTIDADDLTLYLVLDEAHRGFNTRTSSDKPTIVRRGRSRATADAVRPLNVGTRIACAPSASAMSHAAFDIACPIDGSSEASASSWR